MYSCTFHNLVSSIWLTPRYILFLYIIINIYCSKPLICFEWTSVIRLFILSLSMTSTYKPKWLLLTWFHCSIQQWYFILKTLYIVQSVWSMHAPFPFKFSGYSFICSVSSSFFDILNYGFQVLSLIIFSVLIKAVINISIHFYENIFTFVE